VSRLEIEKLAKSFGPLRAVDGVSLAIDAGETVVLLGASGCGKTTLLRLVAGFLLPDEGTIRIAGREVASPHRMVPPERRALSMVFQSYAVWPHKTVYENVAYGLRLRRLGRHAVEAEVGAALELVRMAEQAGRYPGELSGGQQQRVALARALALRPEILLFDEPLSNLDAALREHTRFEIRSLLARLGITAIYVTHDQQEAMVIGDRIAVMNRGRIEQIGRPEELYRASRTPFVARFIGMANTLEARLVGPGRIGVVGLGELSAATPAGLPPGASVQVFVRPESVRLDGVAGAANSFRARVLRRTFLGASIDLLVAAEAAQLRALVSGEAVAPAVGDDIVCRVAPESCLVFGS
jgi:iron(III) transport system ATP-binding protein